VDTPNFAQNSGNRSSSSTSGDEHFPVISICGLFTASCPRHVFFSALPAQPNYFGI
jgi:hypothetical protein